MIDKPKITVGLPVFNGEAYLPAAIDSILAQTENSLLLVISDNASTDSTEAICREFAARDSRIKYLRNTTNVGAHPNYNITFRHAESEFFKWAAHDDLLEPRYIERCLAALGNCPDAVLCQTDLRYIDGDGTAIGTYKAHLLESDAADPVTRFKSLTLRAHPAYAVMGVYRRDALDNSLLLASFHGSDRALLAELSLRGSFIQVPEPLLIVRDHENRYTQSHLRPKDRAAWHDTRLAGKASFPAWRLYGEYWKMVGRNLDSGGARIRCYLGLLKWLFVNWNGARLLVDVISSVVPDFVIHAERFKQRFFSPQPGAGDARSRATKNGPGS